MCRESKSTQQGTPVILLQILDVHLTAYKTSLLNWVFHWNFFIIFQFTDPTADN